MIGKEELREYARLRGLNLGQAEKDYFQNIILFILYQHYGRGLVFKGGTAISKCYNSKRFSEDLDFTSLEKFDSEIVELGLKRFGIWFEKEEKESNLGIRIIFRIRGPLYSGLKYTLCRLRLDISYREKVLLPPNIKTIGRFMEEIPEFDVWVMREEEILAEKVRAILKRAKAKDIYDLWFLLRKGVSFDLELVNEKLKYYKMKWSRKRFFKAMNINEKSWEAELKPLVKNVPEFKDVKKFIREKLGKA